MHTHWVLNCTRRVTGDCECQVLGVQSVRFNGQQQTWLWNYTQPSVQGRMKYVAVCVQIADVGWYRMSKQRVVTEQPWECAE